jgi:hypothetical protein
MNERQERASHHSNVTFSKGEISMTLQVTSPITAFAASPDRARGLARDMRVRQLGNRLPGR